MKKNLENSVRCIYVRTLAPISINISGSAEDNIFKPGKHICTYGEQKDSTKLSFGNIKFSRIDSNRDLPYEYIIDFISKMFCTTISILYSKSYANFGAYWKSSDYGTIRSTLFLNYSSIKKGRGWFRLYWFFKSDCRKLNIRRIKVLID